MGRTRCRAIEIAVIDFRATEREENSLISFNCVFSACENGVTTKILISIDLIVTQSPKFGRVKSRKWLQVDRQSKHVTYIASGGSQILQFCLSIYLLPSTFTGIPLPAHSLPAAPRPVAQDYHLWELVFRPLFLSDTSTH